MTKRTAFCVSMARSARSARPIASQNPRGRFLARGAEQSCLMLQHNSMLDAGGQALTRQRSPIGSRRYWIGPTAWSEWKCAALPATVTWGICFLMAQPLRAIDTASMEFA